MSNRLILTNYDVSQARELRAELGEVSPDISVRAGFEHGADPTPWIELVLSAEAWTKYFLEFLQSLGPDARAGVVGYLVVKFLEKLGHKQKDRNRDGLSELTALLQQSGVARVVLSIENDSEVQARLHLEAPTKEELVRAVMAVASTATKIEEKMADGDEESHMYGWQLELEGEQLALIRDVPGQGRQVILLNPDLPPR